MNTAKIVVEGYGAFDGVKLWEERHTAEICAAEDADFMAEVVARGLESRYQVAAKKRGKTSWQVSEPGELQLWVRAYPVD